MDCRYCGAANTDGEHRCRRCGRRMDGNLPVEIPPRPYPRRSHGSEAPAIQPQPEQPPPKEYRRDPAQQHLFGAPESPKVLPFQPPGAPAGTPLQRRRPPAARLGGARPRPGRRAPGRDSTAQGSLEFGRPEFAGPRHPRGGSQSVIYCKAPVAPLRQRIRAAALDWALILAGLALAVLPFYFWGLRVAWSKRTLPWVLAGALAVPLAYKLLVAMLVRESPGMRRYGLRLIDFDGRPPAPGRRVCRALVGCVSCLALGVGLIWALFDEEHLTWHDHVSKTFLTPHAGDKDDGDSMDAR